MNAETYHMMIDLPVNADPEPLARFAKELDMRLHVHNRDVTDTPYALTAPTVRTRYSPVRRIGGLRLRPGTGEAGDRYRAHGQSGRRLNAISWEGHRAWLAKVFESYPDAIVRTALANYYGAADFAEKYRITEDAYDDPRFFYGADNADNRRWLKNPTERPL